MRAVDEAGRYHEEAFGNDTATTRSYFTDRQTLKSLVTQREATVVQDLAYTYDARLNLASRTDALQPTHPTERFRYDGLERLKCAYFSLIEDPAAPCALDYQYKPDGNLSFKSDVGVVPGRGETVLGEPVKKLINEGTWFAVPLRSGGFAVGVVARSWCARCLGIP